MSDNIQDLISNYREIRDALDAKRKEWQTFEKEQKLALEVIEMQLLVKADELGVDSFKTSCGTAFKTTKKDVQIVDWTKFSDYVLKNNAIHLLQKRVAKNATLDDMEEGEHIPGIDVIVTREIQVRK